jgi:signal transduction histidine kinase
VERPFEYADQPWRGVTYWHWTLVPVRGEGGEVAGLVLSLLDVTPQVRSRRQVEELAAVAQRRAAELQAVLDNMADGVYVCDAERRVTLANEAGARLLGLAGVGEAARPLAEYPALFNVRHLDGRPAGAGELPLARALAGDEVVQEGYIIRNLRSERDAYIRTSAAPIRGADGEIVAAVEVARDVTELVELDRLKDEFIAVAAHELKTPVAIMKGYAQALLRGVEEASPQRRRMLEAVDRGADRIGGVVDDLLDVSRLLAGSLELASERVDLRELAEEVVDRAAAGAPNHRVVLEAQPVVVHGDRGRLEQVLANLLDNAIRYSPAGGDVEVRLAVCGDEAVVAVRDYGIGIPQQKQGRIFQRFYRAHTRTPHDYGGLGVGLYISREIVRRHGGRMWFTSEEGKGSTFAFSLPLG